MIGGIHVTGGGGSGAGAVYGTYASRPSPGTRGRVFIPSDGLVHFMDDGSAWLPIMGGKLGTQVPLANTWTQVNMSNATLSDAQGTLLLKAPYQNSTTTNRIVVTRAAPATPFTLTAGISMTGWPAPTTGVGIVYRDSASGRLILSQLVWTAGGHSIQLQNWTNPTTFSTNIQNMSAWPEDVTGSKFYLHLRDPGAGNLVWSYSKDGDYDNSLIIDQATNRTAFLASPDHIGIVIVNESTEARARVAMRLFDWTLTS